LILVIEGATAVGGGLITLVVELEVESEVLLLVLSVTIAFAITEVESTTIATAANIFFMLGVYL
jgi:hypothetical protein